MIKTMVQSGEPDSSPVTARYVEFSSAALKALSQSGAGLADMLLAAVPRETNDSAARQADNSIYGVTNQKIRDIFSGVIDSVGELFSEIAPDVSVPDTATLEDADVNFAKLAEGYEAYEKAGLEPELVLAPVNASLSFWRRCYSRLRAWQDIHDSQSAYKLQNHPGGDGLWVLEYVEHTGDTIVESELRSPTSPGTKISTGGFIWQIAVISGTEKAAETAAVEGAGELLPIGLYLILQATRIFLRKTPVDRDGWTALGSIPVAAGQHPAHVVRGNFGTVNGLVYLYDYITGGTGGRVGKRTPVWG